MASASFSGAFAPLVLELVGVALIAVGARGLRRKQKLRKKKDPDLNNRESPFPQARK